MLWWTTTFFVALGGGLLLGWFVLPEPAFVRKIWVKLGLADRVP